MKFALLVSMLLISLVSAAAELPSNILNSTEACDDDNSKNLITFEKIVKLEDGSFWVKNIHLKADNQFYRVKANKINKSRICKDLGFDLPRGSRVEFEKGEKVVGINGKLKVIDHKRDESKFVLNLNCSK